MHFLMCHHPIPRIIFGIVRLAGLYEIIAKETCPEGVRFMETLYDALNDHLMGSNMVPTDAYKFTCDMTTRAEWVGHSPKQASRIEPS